MFNVKHLLAITLAITTGTVFADHMAEHTIDKRTAKVSKVNVAKPAAETAASAGHAYSRSDCESILYCLSWNGYGQCTQGC